MQIRDSLIITTWFPQVTTQGRIILIRMCRKAFDLSWRSRNPTSLRWWKNLLRIKLLQACIYFCSLNLVKGCLPWRLLFRLMSAQRWATKSSEVLSLCHSWHTAFESSRILLVLQLTKALFSSRSFMVLEHILRLGSTGVFPWTLNEDLLKWLQSQISAGSLIFGWRPMRNSWIFSPWKKLSR